MRKRILSLAIVALTSIALPAGANDWSVLARVTSVEATYMPGHISFKVDTTAGNCPAGTFLTWSAQGSTEAAKIANVNAVYAGLISALHTNRQVTLFGVNSGCAVQYIHFN